MKKILWTLLFFLGGSVWYAACEACKLQQPEITQELTHGTGPNSRWDWLIVALIAAITLYTLFYALKYLIRPGEKNKEHIKNEVLEF